MRATNIRIAGKKPTREQLKDVVCMLNDAYQSAGYLTGVEISGAAVLISSGLGQFRVDTDKLGHNARFRRWGSPVRGYVRTDVPTWEQRVDFNNITNRVFDAMDATATIRSGPFTVRDRDGAHTWWDRNAYPAADIVPLTAEMLAEGAEAIRAHRRAKRAARKAEGEFTATKFPKSRAEFGLRALRLVTEEAQ
jgi:hypothetical protein